MSFFLFQTVVYHVLDTFISESMLRRLFSFRRPKLEEKETPGELQKENADPNCQVQRNYSFKNLVYPDY